MQVLPTFQRAPAGPVLINQVCAAGKFFILFGMLFFLFFFGMHLSGINSYIMD